MENNQKSNNWEEEINKIYSTVRKAKYQQNGTVDIEDALTYPTPERIKQIFQDARTTDKLKLLEGVEGLRKPLSITNEYTPTINDLYYNSAIEDIKDLINNHYNEN